jgi:hypothetical protein
MARLAGAGARERVERAPERRHSISSTGISDGTYSMAGSFSAEQMRVARCLRVLACAFVNQFACLLGQTRIVVCRAICLCIATTSGA